jgi:hypothetical protein
MAAARAQDARVQADAAQAQADLANEDEHDPCSPQLIYVDTSHRSGYGTVVV